MSFETWQQENRQPAPVSTPVQTSGFEAWQAENKQTATPPEKSLGDIMAEFTTAHHPRKVSTKFAKQAVGALAKGGMRVGEAVTAIPENVVRLAKTISEVSQENIRAGGMGSWSPAGTYIAARRVREDPEIAARIEEGLTAKLKSITNMHRRGQQAILAAHPEWESDPPESFVDLLTSPRKLVLSLLESAPLLMAAGITTAAGQPALSVSMMFTTEFQDMKNQALADGRTEQEAQAAGLLYAPVAAAIEQMQLQGIMTVAKGMHKPLVGLVAKKIAAKGMKLTYPIIKTTVNEAIEEMAQGSWQEASAKLVYDKSVPGGLRGFIDRRAQEGLIGATMGLVPGLGGKAIRGMASTTEATRPGAVRKAEVTPMPTVEGVEFVPDVGDNVKTKQVIPPSQIIESSTHEAAIDYEKGTVTFSGALQGKEEGYVYHSTFAETPKI